MDVNIVNIAISIEMFHHSTMVIGQNNFVLICIDPFPLRRTKGAKPCHTITEPPDIVSDSGVKHSVPSINFSPLCRLCNILFCVTLCSHQRWFTAIGLKTFSNKIISLLLLQTIWFMFTSVMQRLGKGYWIMFTVKALPCRFHYKLAVISLISRNQNNRIIFQMKKLRFELKFLVRLNTQYMVWKCR